jgi:hypothetical protein
MRPRTRRLMAAALVALVALGGAVAYGVWYYLFRTVPRHYASPVEHFRYGSIGVEEQGGMPYWIWAVLPRVFADKLPGEGGYASLGLVWERGRDTPIGFSVKTIGFERVALNCAFCHTSTVRLRPGEPPMILDAATSHQVLPQEYLRFLFAAASDPRFTADTLLAAIDEVHDLPWTERLLYRYVLIPQTRKAILKQKAEYAWMEARPPWGRGRIDPFNPVKYGILRQPVDQTIGNADMVPLWNQRPRQGMALHWDGLSGSLTETVRSSALGDGATRDSIPLADLQRLQDWLTDLPPPKYPLPVNEALARRGASVFARECAECHAFGGPRTGTVIPLETVGTDRHRLDMWTSGAAAAYNDYGRGYDWDFSGFRKTNGYVAVPLDGLWARAPYLHNGSVPTLADLLEKPERRPQLFYRGYDLLDPERVGFVTSGPEAERVGFRYETRVPGNGNGGHLWGTELPPDEKRALLEFLKTQ